MPLCPLLSNQPFLPETKRTISLAFERVCGSLGLNVQDDPATRLVAEKIIALAKRDISDVETLRDMTLREFGKETSAGSGSLLGVNSWATGMKNWE
jgi:hypothetical protein